MDEKTLRQIITGIIMGDNPDFNDEAKIQDAMNKAREIMQVIRNANTPIPTYPKGTYVAEGKLKPILPEEYEGLEVTGNPHRKYK